MVNTIWFRFDLIRFQKYFSVYIARIPAYKISQETSVSRHNGGPFNSSIRYWCDGPRDFREALIGPQLCREIAVVFSVWLAPEFVTRKTGPKILNQRRNFVRTSNLQYHVAMLCYHGSFVGSNIMFKASAQPQSWAHRHRSVLGWVTYEMLATVDNKSLELNNGVSLKMIWIEW